MAIGRKGKKSEGRNSTPDKKKKIDTKKQRGKRIIKKGGVSIRSLRQFYPALLQISKTKNPSRISNILNEIPNSGINTVCECLYNALYSKGIDKRSLAKLKKLNKSTKENVRALALSPKNKGIRQKRILLRQSGAGIGTIIASVLPLLLSLFGRK